MGLSQFANATQQGPQAQGPQAQGPQAQGAPAQIDDATLRRVLMARATFGHRADDRERLDALGYDAWLDEQLRPQLIDDSALDAKLSSFAWIGLTAHELRAQHGGGGWTLSEASKAVRLLRAAESKRQLFERVVDLWNDHFNVPFSAQDANFLRPPHEENVVRMHALGRFPQLLEAVCKSSAMAAYLDQDSNIAGAPNENFARELLELFCLGEGNGYSEFDVVEVARCFTGWGYVRHFEPGTFGERRFDPSLHDNGPKVVLGREIPSGQGAADVDIVLAILVRHPATARRVASRIVRWFLGREAMQRTDAVERVVDVYNSTGGNIAAMVRETLSSASMLEAQPWRSKKLKQPFHFAVSLLRSVGARITSPTTAVYALAGLGQVPFEWPDPDGYPEDAETWSGTLAPRWRFAANLLNGWASWVDVDAADLSGLCFGAAPEHWGRCVSSALMAGAMQPADVAAIDAFVAGSSSPGAHELIGAFELAASSPSFQTY